MGFIDVKKAWEIEKHDGWGSEENTRFANLVVPYEGNEWLHQMAKAFNSGFSYGQRFIEDERKKEIDKLKDYVRDQENERLLEKKRADDLKLLLDMVIENRNMWEEIANERNK